eukprot:1145490-Pelagomonas_calceolata.AAC.3
MDIRHRAGKQQTLGFWSSKEVPAYYFQGLLTPRWKEAVTQRQHAIVQSRHAKAAITQRQHAVMQRQS